MRHGTSQFGDPFFTQSHCDRCGQDLHNARSMSWWTKDCLCMECKAKEDPIKSQLRELGISDAMEGCGYIPDPSEQKQTTKGQS